MYPEIDKDGAPNTAAVATYVGTDPEGDTISWDLRGADAALFTIAGGVLKFVNSPDFEDPKDVVGRQHGYTRSRVLRPMARVRQRIQHSHQGHRQQGVRRHRPS